MTEGPDEAGTSGSYTRAYPTAPKKAAAKKRKVFFYIIGLVAVVLLGFLASILVLHSSNSNALKKMQGKVAMSEQQLRDLVKAQHLTVYWAGPIAGDLYALVAQKAGQASVRYLPAGRGLTDTGSSFRIIATYPQKGAFQTTQAAGKQIGSVGFINVDGNSVFYVKTRPTNVYIGIKGQDIQLEIFDPSIDQALGVALVRGQIQLIS